MQNDIDKDLYEILGVDRSASTEEIKAAYRKRARECHPDVARDDPDAEYKFKELTFAYEILTDPERRREYDAYGLEGLRRGAGGGFGFTSLHDIIEMFFGEGFPDPFGRSTRRSRTQGRDMEMVMEVTLEQVLTGFNGEVEVERNATCGACSGSGLAPGSRMSRCAACGGSGQVRVQQRGILGTIIRTHTCRTCGGAGEMVDKPCTECGGSGRRQVSEKISVSVPPGVERGDRLRVRGKGEGGIRGGTDGDLYIVIDVVPHQLFERSGKDLLTSVDVDMVDAALGCELELPSLDGVIKLKVPSGTQSGDVLKVKGKGLPPRYGGRKGDIYARVNIIVPDRLSQEQRKALEAYRKASKKTAQ